MLQLPSNLAAIAGGAEQMIARALDRAKAHIRLPIMKVLMGIIRLIGEARAKGGTPGLPVPLGGTYDGGRQNPSQPCRPGPATLEPLWLAVRFARRRRGNG